MDWLSQGSMGRASSGSSALAALFAAKVCHGSALLCGAPATLTTALSVAVSTSARRAMRSRCATSSRASALRSTCSSSRPLYAVLNGTNTAPK